MNGPWKNPELPRDCADEPANFCFRVLVNYSLAEGGEGRDDEFASVYASRRRGIATCTDGVCSCSDIVLGQSGDTCVENTWISTLLVVVSFLFVVFDVFTVFFGVRLVYRLTTSPKRTRGPLTSCVCATISNAMHAVSHGAIALNYFEVDFPRKILFWSIGFADGFAVFSIFFLSVIWAQIAEKSRERLSLPGKAIASLIGYYLYIIVGLSAMALQIALYLLFINSKMQDSSFVYFFAAKLINSFFFILALVFILNCATDVYQLTLTRKSDNQSCKDRLVDATKIALGCGWYTERKRKSSMMKHRHLTGGTSMSDDAALILEDDMFYQIRYNLVSLTSSIFYLTLIYVCGDFLIVFIHSTNEYFSPGLPAAILFERIAFQALPVICFLVMLYFHRSTSLKKKQQEQDQSSNKLPRSTFVSTMEENCATQSKSSTPKHQEQQQQQQAELTSVSEIALV